MSERFTYPARQAVWWRRRKPPRSDIATSATEHLLLGLLREESSLAAAVLATFEVALKEVQAAVARLVRPAEGRRGGNLVRFTPRARKGLKLGMSRRLSSATGRCALSAAVPSDASASLRE